MFIAHKKRAHQSFLPVKQAITSFCLGLCLACPSLAWSADADGAPDQPAISLHGFGTLGVARGNDDHAQFVRDLSQPNGAGKSWNSTVDSLLGLQANIRLGASTEGVVQVVSRYHADSSYRPELTWAFLRHDFSPDVSLRVGRLGTEFYMLGDSRLVGYSNLSVRPSSDFYGSLVFSYIDGADISATLPVASGLLKAKLFAGQSPEKTPYAPGLLWDLTGSTLMGGYLDYQSGPWQFRASLAQVQFNREMPVEQLLQANGYPSSYPPYLSLVPEMSMAGQRARFSSLGLVYDQGPLNVQLMLNQIRYDSLAYADSRSAYVLAGYRLGALTPYAGVSYSLSEAPPFPSSPVPYIDNFTQSLVSQSYTDQKTYTVGARWDLQKNLALKAQVDWIRGKPDSVFLLKGTQSGGWDGNMTVFSLALDFVF